MNERFLRYELLVGKESLDKLSSSHVLLLGVGGVGGYAAEALARSGIGEITIVDGDSLSITNINRQIIALTSTIGLSKVDVMEKRIKDINPNCIVNKISSFIKSDSVDLLFTNHYDFVIDAIDTITIKILVIKKCLEKNIPFISCMGMANKKDPFQFKIMDIKKTEMDPVARVIRLALRKDNIKGNVPVLISLEKPIKQEIVFEEGTTRKEKMPPGSNAFIPPMAGLILASYAVNKLI